MSASIQQPAVYRRVLSHESTGAENDDEMSNSTSRVPTHSLAERCVDKGIALVWMSLAVVTQQRCHVYSTLFSLKETKAIQPLLCVVALLLGIQVVLALYLIVYLPFWKRLDSSAWSVYCPRVIPTATALGIVSIVLLVRACWPVWGCLTPLILGIQAMGALFALHFVPWPFGASG